MPTPVRVRGKAGNKRRLKAFSNGNSNIKDTMMAPSSVKPPSRLEMLPNELLQDVLWQSLNLNLALASPILAQKLNNLGLRRRLVYVAFFECAWWKKEQAFHVREAELRLFYPHSESQSDLMLWEKHELQHGILRAPWFTSNTFLSCLREYTGRVIPPSLQNLIPQDLRSDEPQWPFAKSVINSRSPNWFRDLLRRPPSAGESRLFLTLIFCGYTDQEVMLFGPAHDAVTASTFDIEKRSARRGLEQWACACGFDEPNSGENRFTIGLGEVRYDRADEFPARLVSVKHWTMEQLAFIYLMRGKQRYFVVRSSEVADAFSEAMVVAIKQGHLLAVLLLSQTLPHNDVSGHGYYGEEFAITDTFWHDAASRAEYEYAAWIALFEKRRCTMHLEVKDGAYHLVAMAHVELALQLAIGRNADENRLAVFQLLSFIWLKVHCHAGAAYPEQETRQIHATILGHGSTKVDNNDNNSASRTYGKKCYEFFSETATSLWKRSRD